MPWYVFAMLVPAALLLVEFVLHLAHTSGSPAPVPSMDWKSAIDPVDIAAHLSSEFSQDDIDAALPYGASGAYILSGDRFSVMTRDGALVESFSDRQDAIDLYIRLSYR